VTIDGIQKRRRRIKQVKKWLKPLPRRSNVHRYPVLKWFAESAKKKSYLWSFRGSAVIPAIYFGMVIAMMPLVGAQMLLVSLLALFLVRANLPVLIGLQWISNPFTMGPIYYADYQIGIALMELVGFDPTINPILRPSYDWSDFQWNDLSGLLNTFPPMMIGGLILGSFAGIIGITCYKYLAKRSKADYLCFDQNETSEGKGSKEV
jgi:uncharacterized protein